MNTQIFSRSWKTIMLIGLPAAIPLSAKSEPPGKQLNVLFIAVDDLKPLLGCYGDKTIKTPNIDRLAGWGTVFLNAYCQQAVSAPTRASLLTGFRPDQTKVHDLNTPLVTVRPDLVTLPALFKKNGYTSVSLGKIFHHGKADSPGSWSIDPWNPPAGQWVDPANIKWSRELSKEGLDRRPWAFERFDAPDSQYRDGQIAEKAIAHMREFKKSGEPFFLAAGFHKPHLPFVCPEKYWKLYDNVQITLPEYDRKPVDGPDIAMTTWGEIRKYAGIPQKGPVPADTAVILIKGYMACVSFLDAQVGLLLDEIERLGLRENTLIVLWGDHGWHLGDHGLWCKHTNFEQATHAPLIMYVPGIKGGNSTKALVEFVDIYPSVSEACGVTPPTGLEGKSYLPLMRNPAAEWKEIAYSQYPRGRNMGYSARSSQYRFTGWFDQKGQIFQSELYDYQNDPDETVNLASKPEYSEVVARMSRMVKEYSLKGK